MFLVGVFEQDKRGTEKNTVHGTSIKVAQNDGAGATQSISLFDQNSPNNSRVKQQLAKARIDLSVVGAGSLQSAVSRVDGIILPAAEDSFPSKTSCRQRATQLGCPAQLCLVFAGAVLSANSCSQQNHSEVIL